MLPDGVREEFQKNGYIIVTDALPTDEFLLVQSAILESKFNCRSQRQGDTITRRVPVGPKLRREIPQLSALLESPRWKGLMAYVASTRAKPLYYIQTIAGGVIDGPPDPQLQLHSDTFHPSLKAWLFLEDVEEDGRPLSYVPGSHRLSPARVAWEYRKSVEVLVSGDPLSKRGSLRIDPNELHSLGLPPPIKFCVAANTLVLIDTCGFHARSSSESPTIRVELWGYCRRTPFLPWAFAGPSSWGPLAERRAEWLNVLADWLDWCGVRRQHWAPGGFRRPKDFQNLEELLVQAVTR